MKHIRLKTFAVMSAVFATSPTYAGVVGTQSDDTTIKVGSSMWIPFGPHADPAGLPGIGIKGVGLGQWGKISMNSVKRLAESNPQYGGTDANSVTHVEPPAHSGRDKMGVFDFQKIADNRADVYFGEWQAKENGTINPNTRSVFYVGKDKTTNMPTSGSATYTVNGINNYTVAGLMTGTLTANFGPGTNTLAGTISNSALTVDVNAAIAPSTASFAGTATANPTGGTAVSGTSQGHFFGNAAAQLAGIAKFGEANRNLDTAFGGKKQ